MTAALCGWEAKNSSTSCLPAVGGNSAAIHCSIAATAAGDLAARKPSTISRATRQSGCWRAVGIATRSEEHTSELQSRLHLVCRLLLEKKKKKQKKLQHIKKKQKQET